MRFKLSKIEKSRSDIKRNIKFPTVLNKDLAELLGILVGDGSLGFYSRKNIRGSSYYIQRLIRIACNKKELDYIQYIVSLFYNLFNLKLKIVQDTKPNSIILRAQSKGILQFLNELCGLPLNRKSEIVSVPKIVKEATDEIKCAFIRGLTDTDFSVSFKNKTKRGHSYPMICGSFKSKLLINDLEVLFKELGFTYCVYYDSVRIDKRFTNPITMHHIYLNGEINLKRWIDKIGFSNSKFIDKVDFWLKNGVCPPKYKEVSEGI